MIRLFLAVAGMFFLPFFIYAAYIFVHRRGKLEGNLLQDAPVNWLSLAGTILAIGTLASLVSTDILEYEQKSQTPAASESAQTPGRSR